MISIASHAHCRYRYFQWCVEYGPQRPNLGAIKGPKVSKSSGLWSFSQTFSTAFASVLVYISTWETFKGVLNIGLRLRGPISRSFWAPKQDMIQVFQSFSQILSTGFTSFLLNLLIGGMFRCISRCILGRELGPSGVSPDQRFWWKHVFSLLKHV